MPGGQENQEAWNRLGRMCPMPLRRRPPEQMELRPYPNSKQARGSPGAGLCANSAVLGPCGPIISRESTCASNLHTMLPMPHFTQVFPIEGQAHQPSTSTLKPPVTIRFMSKGEVSISLANRGSAITFFMMLSRCARER